MKIKSFNRGTLISKHNQLEYTINKDLCNFNDVEEVKKEMLTEQEVENKYYFPLKDIKEAENYYTFEYTVEDNYSNLHSVKNESRTLKLSLLDYILEIQPLDHHYTVLDPANIYYRNIEDVKIGFRGHEWLPKEEVSDLEQYKLLILGMISKFNYARYKQNKFTLLSKEKDTFLHTVNNAESFSQLKKIVRKELNDVQTTHLLNEEQRNRTNKRMRNVSIIGAILVLTALSVIAVIIFNNQLQDNLASDFAQAEQLENENTIYRDLYHENYQQATQSMVDSDDFTDEEVINIYKEQNMYEQLIEIDNNETPYVIEDLRTNEQFDTIRELAFQYEDNLVLQNELAIIDEDMTQLISADLASMYEEQMLRAANLGLENDNQQLAEDINEQINSPSIQVSILESRIEQLELDKQNTNDDAEESSIDDDIADLDNQIQELVDENPDVQRGNNEESSNGNSNNNSSDNNNSDDDSNDDSSNNDSSDDDDDE